MKKYFFVTSLFFLVLVLVPQAIFAVDTPPEGSGTPPDTAEPVSQQNWCLTAERVCVQGGGGPCSGTLFPSQSACTAAIGGNTSCSNDSDCDSTSDCLNNVCVQTSSPAPSTPTTDPSTGNGSTSGTNTGGIDGLAIKNSFPSISSLNPIGNLTVEGAIGRVVQMLLGVLGSIAIVIFIYGGLLWMTARGNGDQVGKAISTIAWGAMGILVIFASYAIIGFVLQTVL